MLQDIPVCYRTYQYATGLTSILQYIAGPDLPVCYRTYQYITGPDLPVCYRTYQYVAGPDLPVCYRTYQYITGPDLPVCYRTYQYVAGWANTLLDSGVEEDIPDVASDTVAENGSHDNW